MSLLLLLQTRRQMTGRELARELEVSLRTVYRDVEALSAAGVPVYAEQGRAGGYRLVEGYRTRLTGLTEPEAASLFMVGIPEAATALGIADHTSSAELKLLAALAPTQRAQAARLRERFHLDVPTWYRQTADEPHLPAVAEAVLSDRVIDMVYRRWAAPREVERTLEPYGVVLKGGAWYVVAREHSPRRPVSGRARSAARTATFRTYRVANILRLTPTELTFERDADFDLAEHWRRRLAEFDDQRFTASATVRLSPALVDRLPDISSTHLARTVASSGPSTGHDGSVTVRLPIESVSLAAIELIGYGADLEVLDPPALRDELARLAASVLAVYEA